MDLLVFATNHLLKTTPTTQHERVAVDLQPSLTSFYNSSSPPSTGSDSASSESSPSIRYHGLPTALTSHPRDCTLADQAAACSQAYFNTVNVNGPHDSSSYKQEQSYNRRHRMSVSSLLNDDVPPSPPEIPPPSKALNGTKDDLANMALTDSWKQLNVTRSSPLPSPTSPVSVSSPPIQSIHTHQLTPPTPNVRVNLYDLVSSGILAPNTVVTFRDQTATVTSRGTLSPNQDPDYPLPPWLQTEFETPSAFATAIVKAGRNVKVAVNGWSAVKVCVPINNSDDSNEDGPGNTDATVDVSLDVLRKRYLKRVTKIGTTTTAVAPAAAAAAAATSSNAPEQPRNGWNHIIPNTAISLPPKKRKRASTHGSITTNGPSNVTIIPDEADTHELHDGELRRKWKRNHSVSVVLDRSNHSQEALAPGLDGGFIKANQGIEQEDDAQPRHSRPTASRQHSGNVGGKSRSRRNSSPGASASAHGKRRMSTKARRESVTEGSATVSGETNEGTSSKKRAVVQVVLASLETEPSGAGVVKCVSRAVYPASITRPAMVAIEKNSPFANNREVCFACGGFDGLVCDTKRRGLELVSCDKCGESFHGSCVGIQDAEESSAGWTCPRCVRCIECWRAMVEPPSVLIAGSKNRDTSTKRARAHDVEATNEEREMDQSRMSLQCLKCKQATHLACEMLKDPEVEKQMKEAEANNETLEWVCRRCRICAECGACHGDDEETDALAIDPSTPTAESHNHQQTTSPVEPLTKTKSARSKPKASWSHRYRLCPACTHLLHKGNACPLCRKLYRDDDYDTPMVFCDGCDRWVHVACDAVLKDGDYEQLGSEGTRYYCPFCRDSPARLSHNVEEKLDCVREEASDWHQQEEAPSRPAIRRRGDSFKDLLMAAESLSNGTVVFPDDYEAGYGPQYSPSSSGPDPRSYPASAEAAPYENDPFAAAYAASDLEIPATVTTMESTAAEALLTFLGGGFCHSPVSERFDLLPPTTSSIAQNRPEIQVIRMGNRLDAAKSEVVTESSRIAIRDDLWCVLCISRDGASEELGRLIPFWTNDYHHDGTIVETNTDQHLSLTQWAHTECLVWTTGVTQEEDGGLLGVAKAVETARRITCKSCGLLGASVACRGSGCHAIYHLSCVLGRASGNDVVAGDGPETVYCAAHKNEQIIDVVEYEDPKSSRKGRRIFVKDCPSASFAQKRRQNGGDFVDLHMMLSPYVFRAGALTIRSLGEYPSMEGQVKLEELDAVCYRVGHDDTNAASDEDVQCMTIPLGYSFERWVPDWRDSTGATRVKVVCEYVVTPEVKGECTGRKLDSTRMEEDMDDESKVIVRTDTREDGELAPAKTPLVRYAWKVTTIEPKDAKEEEAWHNSIVDMMSYLLKKYKYHQHDAEATDVKMEVGQSTKDVQIPFWRTTFTNDHHLFELQPAAFCGLDQPRLISLLSSMKGCQQTNTTIRQRQDIILVREAMSSLIRGRAMNELKRKRAEGAVNEYSCARTEGRFKMTRRKVRKIGRSMDGVVTGVPSGGVGTRAQQSFMTVLGQLRSPTDGTQLMTSATVVGKFRTMKLAERENVVLRPCWGSIPAPENGEIGSYHAGTPASSSSAPFGSNHNSDYRQQHLHPRRRSSVGTSLFGNGDFFHGSSSSSFAPHTSAPSSPLLPRQSQHPFATTLNATCPTSFLLCTARTFEKDEMILEYVGEVIGEQVAEMRKRVYARQSRGCYMIYGTEDWVIDATRVGGKAKYIGHDRTNVSICLFSYILPPRVTQPTNAHFNRSQATTYARVLYIDNSPHIVFHAARHLEPDEELTFGYEVSSEEENIQSGEH